MAEKNVGKIVQIIGPVIDVEFEAGHLPDIYNALHVVSDGKGGAAALDVICEVEQHLGENRVRAVAMKPTDGMQRGMKAIDPANRSLSRSVRAPGACKRLEPVDFPDRPPKTKERWPIHRLPPVSKISPPTEDVRNRHQGHRPA
jgi:F-type H+-transporting ATPase subunit beta